MTQREFSVPSRGCNWLGQQHGPKQKGQSGGEAGQSGGEAGQSGGEAGQSGGEAGQSGGEAGQSGGEAGEKRGRSGAKRGRTGSQSGGHEQESKAKADIFALTSRKKARTPSKPEKLREFPANNSFSDFFPFSVQCCGPERKQRGHKRPSALQAKQETRHEFEQPSQHLCRERPKFARSSKERGSGHESEQSRTMLAHCWRKPPHSFAVLCFLHSGDLAIK